MSDGSPQRLLVIMPSWIGDAVMATPTLRLLRASFPGALIGALMRPGIDEVLEDCSWIDEWHVDHAQGVMGPKRVAQRLRRVRYDTALLLTNSFSTALVARLAWIKRRIGYDRDARGLLLTDRIKPEKKEGGGFAPAPAVEYYLRAAGTLVGEDRAADASRAVELPISEEQGRAAAGVLEALGLRAGRYVVLNPGANNEAKRWPAASFGALGAALARDTGLSIAVTGSPAERDVVEQVTRGARQGATYGHVVSLLGAEGMSLGALKAIIRDAALVVTNDTGPRHLAAGAATRCVSLFGPTDHRWTTLGDGAVYGVDGRYQDGVREILVLADPTLGEDEVADEHPERCRIDRIELRDVQGACLQLLPKLDEHRPPVAELDEGSS